MAKEAVTDFSTTPASNTDIGGIGIQGSNQRANFDDAFRELMAQLAETNAGTSPWADTMTIGNSGDLTREFRFNAAGISAGTTRILTVPNYDGTLATLAGTETFSNKTFADMSISGSGTGTFLTITSTDATATAGPDIELYRNSASPAASDVMGGVLFYGEDSADNKELYGSVRATIVDPTSTSEDGEVAIRTVGAGTVADRLHVRLGAYMDGATGTDKGVGTINATAVYDDGVKLGVTPGTAQTTTSGTSIDFTGIPDGVNRVTIILSAVSTTGTSVPIIQIGDSGGVETTGYSGSVSYIDASSAAAANHTTAGWRLRVSGAAASVITGVGVIVRLNPLGTTWLFTYNGSLTNVENTHQSSGAKTLTGTLDRIRVTTEGGTDTFDAGAMNIFYE